MKRALPIIVLIVLGLVAVGLKQCNNSTQPSNDVSTTTTSTRRLNRNPAHINYSKHARCRMDCRHINEHEVEQILKDGKINYGKSELQGEECKKKYAVEGYTSDNQHVRIIFAPCNNEVTVVTVIDLGKEWECNCE